MQKIFFLLFFIALLLGGAYIYTQKNSPLSTDRLDTMSARDYKIYVKKALANNTTSSSYIRSKSSTIINSGYISDWEESGINEQNITVWSISPTSGKLESSKKSTNDKNQSSGNMNTSDSRNTLLSFAGDFPNQLEGELAGVQWGTNSAIQKAKQKASALGGKLPSVSLENFSLSGGEGGILFDPLIDIAEVIPADGGMYFGSDKYK